jgi:cytochrome c oxidase assembly protein subunit 15
MAEGTVAPLPAPERRRLHAFPTLALIAAALTLVVIVASATMRHAQAGLSCGDWPACYAQTGVSVERSGVAIARNVHRTAATGVSLAVLVMLGFVLTARNQSRSARRWTFVAAGIVAALAIVGVATPGARVPAVPLANLLGGIALLAVLAGTHASTFAAPVMSRTLHRMVLATLALAFVQAVLGGLIATQSALLACPAFPGCEGASVSAFVDGQSWNPFRPPTDVGGSVVTPEGAALLHVAHRLNGVLLFGLVLAISARLWQARGGLASGLALTLVTGLGAGFAAALVPSALGVTLVHNACAAVLIALLVRAAVSPISSR